jgi:hypothetical protein
MSHNNLPIKKNLATLCTLQNLSGVSLPSSRHLLQFMIIRIVQRDNTYYWAACFSFTFVLSYGSVQTILGGFQKSFSYGSIVKELYWEDGRKLEAEETLNNLHWGHWSAMAGNTVQDARQQLFQTETAKSLCQFWHETGKSCSSCQRTAREGKIHQHHATLIQKFQPPGVQKRVDPCQWFHTWNARNPDILDKTWSSDEAWLPPVGIS